MIERSVPTQPDRLLAYLQQHGSIRPLEALNELGIYRVADPAHKLRKRGIDVRTRMVKVTNRWDEVTEVAEYYLLQEQRRATEAQHE